MDKDNPLLPFAFTRSNSELQRELPLDTTPRSRAQIDENASSMYHTRKPDSHSSFSRPTISVAPSLKRRFGESFNEKDDIKRRVTAFDDLDSEEPTMIDTTSTDYIEDGDYVSFRDKEMSKSHYDNIPPSSPPIDTNLSSEYDISAKFSIPLSPSQNISHVQNSSPSKVVSHRLESDTDFGIDKFNRFIPADNQCPSTDHDMEDREILQRQINDHAKQVVIEAFEEMRTTIDLEGLGLNEVPHEIKDMNKMVIIGETTQTLHQLYLTNNSIRILSPSLFKYTKLNVLALRQNKIERIPALIKNMVHLTDLSIGSNRLKFLPWQILDLPSLSTFRAGPNPFVKIPIDATRITSSTLNPIKARKFVGKLQYHKSDAKLVPSLKFFCLLQIAQYDVSYQETKLWKKTTPKLYHSLIRHAISQGNFQETCAECDRLVIEPVAEVIEWWDFLQNKDVPFKKEFCSGMCAKKYESKLLEDINDE